MTLLRTIEFIKSHEKELVLFNVDQTDPLVDSLETYFATQNVRIRAERTASGRPAGVAVLSTDDTILTMVSVSVLRELLHDGPAPDSGTGVADAEYEAVLGHLKETTFTSYDTGQLLRASREIEDRARRVGDGSIHAGFQRVSLIAEQKPVYADLTRRGVEVHAYGVPDGSTPNLGPGMVHTVDNEEIAKSWFVIYDGGTDEMQKTALLAREREPHDFYGAWTYDTEIVDRTLTYLEETYLSASDEREASDT